MSVYNQQFIIDFNNQVKRSRTDGTVKNNLLAFVHNIGYAPTLVEYNDAVSGLIDSERDFNSQISKGLGDKLLAFTRQCVTVGEELYPKPVVVVVAQPVVDNPLVNLMVRLGYTGNVPKWATDALKDNKNPDYVFNFSTKDVDRDKLNKLVMWINNRCKALRLEPTMIQNNGGKTGIRIKR